MRGKKEITGPVLSEEEQNSQEAWHNPGKDVNMCQTGVYDSWKDLFQCDLAFQVHASVSVLAMGLAPTAVMGQPLLT